MKIATRQNYMCSRWSCVVVTVVPPSDEKQTCIEEEIMTHCAPQKQLFLTVNYCNYTFAMHNV